MTTRSTMLSVALAAALTLTACGEDSETSATSDDAAPAEAGADTAAETTDETPVETTVGNPAAATDTTADANADGSGDGCDQALTAEEIESILGTPVEISGTGQVCTLTFASDSIGTFQAFSGSKADEAIDTLVPKYQADASARGVLLHDGRGYILDGGALVRGDSGQVFSLGLPDGLDVPDMDAALQAIVNLLLTR